MSLLLKRITAAALAFILVLSMPPGTVLAETVQSSTVASGTCGKNATWELNESGVLTISGYGAMESYLEEVPPWIDYESNIKTLVIEGGITFVGNSAFRGHTNLTDVTLCEGVATIGYWAFDDCTSLARITIPSTLRSIWGNAFMDCDSPTDVYITDLEAWCNIDFNDWSSNPIYWGGGELYLNGEKLTNMTIPEGITELGVAFCGCVSLESVKIPGTVAGISASAFEGCTNLTDVEIEDGVIAIGSYAFQGCTSLKNVSIPDSVVGIGKYAFNNCRSLEFVKIPDSVTELGRWAFAYCSGLEEVQLSSGLTSIQEWTFTKCTSLTQITIPDGVTELIAYAFSNCTGLTGVTIPDSVVSIGECCFQNCAALTNVYYTGTALQWNEITIGTNNTCLTEANIRCEGTVTGEATDGSVYFLREWDPQTQTAYFGSMDLTGSLVTEETDPAVLEIIDDLVGQYVLVKLESRTDGTIGPSTILSMSPVDSRMGVVTAAGDASMTIDGTAYEVAMDVTFPEVYLDCRVLYHLYEGCIVGIEALSYETGTLTFWNAASKVATIDPDSLDTAADYTMSPLADDATLEFLGASGHTNVMVRYSRDNMRFVYTIERYTPPESPSFYDKAENETEDQRILSDAAYEWEAAYENFVRSLQTVLGEMAGTEGALKDAAIAAEASRMQTADNSSDSKQINFNSNFPQQYRKFAYQALATLLYESACQNPEFSSIDLSSTTATVQLVKSIYNSLYQTQKEYSFDNVKIYMNILQMGTSEFGQLTCAVTDPDSGAETNYSAVICSTQSDCEETIRAYLDELKDLAKTAEYNIYTAMCTDILGKPLSSLTKDYLNTTVSKLEKKLAVKLSEKFNIAGIGNVIDMLNSCYTYSSWLVQAAKAGNATELDEAVTKVLGLKFEDQTIENSAVKAAVKKLEKTAEYLFHLSNAYLAGEPLEEQESFWDAVFNCPVSVSVYNSAGEQIGYVGEDDLWYTDAIVITEVGGSKKVTALTDDLLSFEVVGTGYGRMCCSFEEYSDAHTPLGRLNYYDIPITPDRVFAVTLCEDLAVNGDSVTITSGDAVFCPDEYIGADDSACVIITCNTEADDQTAGGSVTGIGTYARGDAVILQAVADAGYQFVGWYSGDTLVCCDETYEVTAKERTNLTAKFAVISYVSVQVIAEEGGNAFGSSRYLPGDMALVYAVPDTYKTFAGWYQDGSMIADTAEYQFKAARDTILTAKFTDHDHTYTGVVTPPTCTEDGYTTYTCACGETYIGDHVEATGHNYGGAGVVTPPTCTEGGYTTYTCACGESYIGDYVEATGHNYGGAGVVTPPTCTEDGYTTYTCECGESYVGDYVKATGHNYGSTGVVTPPTCTENGYTTYTCKCGAVKIGDEVQALHHIYGEWTEIRDGATISYQYTCERCGMVLAETGGCSQIDPTAEGSQAVLYTMDDWAWKYIDIPQTYTMAIQIQVEDDANAYWYVASGESVTVSDTGLITPQITTWYWYPTGSMYYGSTEPVPGEECAGITHEAAYGSSVVRVVCGDKKYDLTVEVRNYCDVYTDAVIDAYIAENISDSMSIEEKMDAICRFPASYDYSADFASASGMVISGGGDCWASTSLILTVCEKLGIEAKARNGNRDPGGGSGHMNVLVTIGDGDYYELEAGYEGTAPRGYHVKHRTSLFCYTSVSGGIAVYQYDGELTEDAVLTVPETIDSKTVLALGNKCFYQEDMREVILPDTLTKIGEQVFAGCSNLDTLHLPASVTSIGQLAFADCLALQNFTCDAENKNYVVRGGVLYNRGLTTLYAAPACTEVTIPDTVDYIGSYAFAYNDHIEEIVFPASVKTLAYAALYGCRNLNRVTVKSAAYISDLAIGGCRDISVYFEGAAPGFGTNAFFLTTADAYYPDDQDGWVEKITQQYGGTVNWTPYSPEPVSTVTYTSASISLAGDIGVNYYAKLSDDIVADEGAYMQFTVAGQPQTIPVSEAVVGDDGNYRFTCKVAAKQMTENITGQMYLGDGTAVGEAKVYSVKAYCDAAIPVYSQYAAYADLVDLMEAMLNYGGYSQVQFGYNTDDLANAGMDTMLPVLTADDVTAYAHGASGSESGISVASVSLLLESTTTIRFYFKLDGTKSIDEYTFYVDGAETMPIAAENGQYYVDKVDVAAKDLDEMVTVTVGGLTVKYCGLSYVRQVAVLYPAYYSEALVNVAKALYAYNQAANIYFG